MVSVAECSAPSVARTVRSTLVGSLAGVGGASFVWAKGFGMVEVDETIVGGRNQPGHPGRSLHRNRIIVLTMVENLGKSGAGGTAYASNSVTNASARC